MRPALLFPLLLLLAALALLAALVSGSLTLAPAELWAALGGGGEPLHRSVLFELRLPRALAAFAAGGLLAVAGALMQVLLRNPLADPYILGVSGGAAVGALLFILAGSAAVWLPIGAFVGAAAATLLVFGLAGGSGPRSSTQLLLTGVVLAAGWGALVNLLLTLAPERALRSMLFWLMGDLSQGGDAGLGLLLLVLAVAAAWPAGRALDLLARGELQAAALGVEVGRLRGRLYFAAALLTATAVTIAGSVGFVGLLVPHLLRLATGSGHRVLLPAAALGGGTLLLAADTLARTVAAPRQLPVGVLTALLGVPVFLWLLRRRGAEGQA